MELFGIIVVLGSGVCAAAMQFDYKFNVKEITVGHRLLRFFLCVFIMRSSHCARSMNQTGILAHQISRNVTVLLRSLKMFVHEPIMHKTDTLGLKLNEDMSGVLALTDACISESPCLNLQPLPVLSNPFNESTLSWSKNLDTLYDQRLYKEVPTECERWAHSSKVSGPTDMILVSALGKYDCHRMSLLLRSLFSTGCNATVFIFNDAPSQCHAIEKSCGSVVHEHIDEFPSVNSEIKPFLVYLRFLNMRFSNHLSRMLSECSRVMLLDFSESFFQTNPFTTIPHYADVSVTDLGFDKNFKISASPFSTQMDIVSYQIVGRKMSVQLENMPAINPSFIFGSFTGIFKLLWVLSRVADLLDISEYTQVTRLGVFNFCFYAGVLDGKVSIAVMPQGISSFVAGTYAVTRTFNGLREIYAYQPRVMNSSIPFSLPENPIINTIGEPFSLITMFLRAHFMSRIEDWVLHFGGIDWQGSSIGTAKYCKIDYAVS